MTKSWIPIAMATVMIAGCAETPHIAQSPIAPLTQPVLATTVGNYRMEKPIEVGNAQLIPVTTVSTPAQGVTDGNVITLAEAKKQGVVEITESYDSNYDNSLKVTNNGTKPILLMGGDLLAGGHQDRIVAHDVVVGPGKSVNVEVFCVEHGRSDGPTEVFTYQDAVVPERVRRAAFMGQQAVWDRVDEFNSAAGIHGGSLTIMSGVASKEVRQSVNLNIRGVQDQLAKQKDVVGVIFIVDGKVQSADIFGNSSLFKTGSPSVLRSYLAEAALSKHKTPEKLDLEQVANFLREINRGRRRGLSPQENGAYSKIAAGKTVGVEMPSKDGGILHGNYARTGN
jgi:hypothetical protein